MDRRPVPGAAVLLIVAFAIPGLISSRPAAASTASASPSPGGVAPPAHSTTSFFIRTVRALRVGTKPYAMTVEVSKHSRTCAGCLDVRLTRRATTGNKPTQRYRYNFSISGSIHIDGSDLLPTSVDTGTKMSSFGKVDMSLTNPGTLSWRQTKCPSGTVTGSISARTGTLSGAFRLNADSNYFHTIKRTSIPVTVAKVYSNGKGCGGGGGCKAGFSFYFGGLQASRPLGTTGMARIGLSYAQFFSEESDYPQVVFHRISGHVPISAFHISRTSGVTIAAGALEPFAMGTIQFKKTGSTTSTHNGCKTTTSDEKYVSGSTTAKFDSGGHKRWGGPGGSGQLTRVRKL